MIEVFTVWNPITTPENFRSVEAAVSAALSVWMENRMETLVATFTPKGQERILVRFSGPRISRR